MKKHDVLVVEENKNNTAVKVVVIIIAILCAVAAIWVAVKYIQKRRAKKILAEVDLEGDGEAEATMIDTDGDGEVDTIVFHEGE